MAGAGAFSLPHSSSLHPHHPDPKPYTHNYVFQEKTPYSEFWQFSKTISITLSRSSERVVLVSHFRQETGRDTKEKLEDIRRY
jgi:hypothetical protein